MMKFAKIFTFLCFLAGVVSAQQGGSLSGTVREASFAGGKRTEAIVSGASVALISETDSAANRTTTTDANGSYRFDNVRPGRYEVAASRPATQSEGGRYEGSSKVTLAAGAAEIKNLVLEHSQVLACGTSRDCPTISERVTVSADAVQTVEQVSKTVNVITGQEMRDRADFALADSLQTIPGFRVQQSGGFGRLATIKSRGLRNQDTALLLDGVRFRDPTAITGDASPFLSDFTLTSVSEIEVLRGSGSSLYGTNAIGGVIDLQTPTARQGTHGQIGGAAGGLGLGRFRGNLSHGLSNGKFGIGGGVSRTVYTKGIDGDDDAHNTNVQARVDVRPLSGTLLTGAIFFSDADVKLNASPDTLGTLPASNATIIRARANANFVPDANDPDSIQQSRFFSGRLSGSHAINENFVVRGYYHGLDTRRQNDNGTLGPGFQSASTSIFDGGIHTANAGVSWTSGTNTLTAGYEYETERFENVGRTPSGTGNFSTQIGQRSNTFFANNLLGLDDDRLQLAGGVRVQKYNLGRPAFSLTGGPYSGISSLGDPPTAYTFDGSAAYYFPKSATKIRAHVGNGYRVPSLYERFGTFYSTFSPVGFVALGDPFLGPEKTTAFDVGIEQGALRNRLRFTGTYFYTKLTDTIGYGDAVRRIGDTDRPFGGYLNQPGGIARGFEASAAAKVTGSFDLFTSYTFTNSDQLTPQVATSGVIRTLGIPDHQFTLVATKRFGRAWVNFDFLATSDYLAPIFSSTFFSTYLYRFTGNRKGDLTAGYTFAIGREKTLRLFGTIANVFDRDYYENGFRTAGASGRAGLSLNF